MNFFPKDSYLGVLRLFLRVLEVARSRRLGIAGEVSVWQIPENSVNLARVTSGLQIQFGGAKPDDLHDSLSFSTKEQLKALTNYPTLSDPFGPERGCPSTQTTRDGSGPMSASARICPSGGDPCGAQTCGSWPRMQSIAADCAPMARMLHQRRV